MKINEISKKIAKLNGAERTAYVMYHLLQTLAEAQPEKIVEVKGDIPSIFSFLLRKSDFFVVRFNNYTRGTGFTLKRLLPLIGWTVRRTSAHRFVFKKVRGWPDQENIMKKQN